MTETPQKHVEKAWVVKVTPKRAKSYLLDCICPRRIDAQDLAGLYRTTVATVKFTVVRVEIREL